MEGSANSYAVFPVGSPRTGTAACRRGKIPRRTEVGQRSDGARAELGQSSDRGRTELGGDGNAAREQSAAAGTRLGCQRLC